MERLTTYFDYGVAAKADDFHQTVFAVDVAADQVIAQAMDDYDHRGALVVNDG